ncbi:MAG: methyl-accepting chemotaxis protein, partial [Chloroflexota bacterium]|nr:methyl-accepting chemotaxis protein [Chloroflexota bacterium]
MLRFFSNIPIFRRLFIAFAVVAAIPSIVIILLGNFYLTSLNGHGQAVQTSFDAQSIASNQLINLQRMNALLQTRQDQVTASLSGVIKDPALFASGALIGSDIEGRQTDFGQVLTEYKNNYTLATSNNMSNVHDILLSDSTNASIINDQQTALNNVTTKQWPAYSALQKQVLNQLQASDDAIRQQGKVFTPAEVNQIFANNYATLFKANLAFTDLKNSWQHVVDDAVSMGKAVTAIGTAETQPILISTTIAAFFIILMVLATGFVVNLTITQPLRQLASMTRRIAKGDTSARARATGHDEIYLVATSMNNMLDNIVRLIQETQAQRDNLQAQVEKLVSEVSGVGEGDLSVQAEVTADALGVLADSFNYMVEELGSLVVRVKTVAHEVESSTTAIFDRLTQLVETGDIQLNQIASAAVEVEHMADSSHQVADRAEVLYTVARDARQSAQGGREAVQQAVEGMGRIHENVQETSTKVQTLGERSREINNIVEVISGIAHQTNRLALDAAIQAAMAGENGKGFGAVAADIRRLAERAKDQASMIGRIVRGVREEIGAVAVSMQDTERETSSGTRLTQEAGVALESIFSAVEQQAREIENINQMAAQQLQSSSNVVQIMRGISNTTQQSTMSTREASHNMERLARLVEQLRASVEAFKLRENQGYYMPPTSNVSVTPVNDQENNLSVSGIFRTVTSTALPSG